VNTNKDAGLEEEPFVFHCEGEELIAILNRVDNEKTGVLIVVGGPQYRVGSHRQFTLLARMLANNDIPVMRFDYRGMGDSAGGFRDFEDVGKDIREAVDVFFARQPHLERIVLWGLCDAASAALFYAHQDERVSGLVLLNPWVRTRQGLNETHIRNYYTKRIRDIDFWKSLIKGKLKISSLLGFVRDITTWIKNKLSNAIPTNASEEEFSQSLPDRMLRGLKLFNGEILLIISGQDLTADEFIRVSSAVKWQHEFERCHTRKIFIDDANHTFSSKNWRAQVETATLEWVEQL